MLRSLLITVIIIRAIDTLKVFDIVFGTTGGGPALATEVVQTFVYRTAYSYQQIGRAMATMILFSLLILAISLALQGAAAARRKRRMTARPALRVSRWPGNRPLPGVGLCLYRRHGPVQSVSGLLGADGLAQV